MVSISFQLEYKSFWNLEHFQDPPAIDNMIYREVESIHTQNLLIQMHFEVKMLETILKQCFSQTTSEKYLS